MTDMTVPQQVAVAEGVVADPAPIEAAVTEPAATPAAPAAAATPAEPAVAPAVLSQADIDRLVEDRVAAAKAEFESKLTEALPNEEPLPTPTDTPTGKVYTQDQLEEHGRVQANRMAQRFADYGELKRRADELPGLTEQLAAERGERASIEAERDQLRQNSMKLEVALDRKLPKELALRLTGLTREEVEADAEALSKLTGIANGGFGGGPSTAEGSPGNDFNSAIREASGYKV